MCYHDAVHPTLYGLKGGAGDVHPVSGSHVLGEDGVQHPCIVASDFRQLGYGRQDIIGVKLGCDRAGEYLLSLVMRPMMSAQSNRAVGIEVKASRQVARTDLTGLASLAERTRKLTRRLVVYLGPRRQRIEGVEVLPLEDFLAEIPGF